MAKQLHWVIPLANELGYFPTARQATEINCRSAALYASHFGGSPPRGRVVDSISDHCLRQAIDEVMTQCAARLRKRKHTK